MKKNRIGLMGFGQVGRQIYRLAMEDARYADGALFDGQRHGALIGGHTMLTVVLITKAGLQAV